MTLKTATLGYPRIGRNREVKKAYLSGLDQYFAIARGKDGTPALEMTKWFDTNYHYLVPEIAADSKPQANFADFLATVQRSQAILGDRTVPIILGPVTLRRYQPATTSRHSPCRLLRTGAPTLGRISA